MKVKTILATLVFVIASGCFSHPDQPAATQTPRASAIETDKPVEASPMPEPTIQPPPAEGWIAFLNKNNLWLIHPDGTELTQITSNTLPKEVQTASITDFHWSPDGKYIAYSQLGSEAVDIFTYDPQSTQTNLLVYGTGGSFDWSANGRQIIYDTPPEYLNPSHNNGIWLINLENGKKRRVIPPTNEISGMLNPSWSKDGSRVIFSILSPAIAGYGISDFATRSAFILPYNGLTGCKWAPVESMIACIKESGGTSSGKPAYKIFLLDVLKQTTKTMPLRDQMDAAMIHWSPDGTQLGIAASDHNRSWTDIYSLTTGEIHKLGPGEVSSWSPDGKWIAISERGADEVTRISVMAVPSGERFNIAEGISPVWQP